jgi:hypothetical protein
VVGEETKPTTDHRPPFHYFWASHSDMYDSSVNQFSVFSFQFVFHRELKTDLHCFRAPLRGMKDSSKEDAGCWV